MKLSLVMPAYNEEARLDLSLRSAAEYVQRAGFEAEVIVVNDGSVDATGEIGERAAGEHSHVRIVHHETNQGKGMAVRTGLLAATGEYGLFCDVDEAVPIEETDKILEAAIEQDADVAIGTRYHRDSVIVRKQPWQRIAVSRVGNLLIRALLLPGLKDTQCGFKLFRMSTMRAAVESITVVGFGVDLEILAIARNWRKKIIEVPVTWVHGEGSTLRLAPTAKNVLMDLLRITWRVRTGFYREEKAEG